MKSPQQFNNIGDFMIPIPLCAQIIVAVSAIVVGKEILSED